MVDGATAGKLPGLAIQGASGRVGQRLIALAPAAGWSVAAAWSRGTRGGGPQIDTEGAEPCLSAANIQVVVDFSSPPATRAVLAWCRKHGVPLVIGTTGLGDSDHGLIDEAAREIAVLQAANTALGVNLLVALVREAAAILSAQAAVAFDAEIVETHHRHKRDAPSGTALALLEAVRSGADWSELAISANPAAGLQVDGRSGDTPRQEGEIGMHAVRLGGVVGDHDVHFASEMESITLSHRAANRDVFAHGALAAARWLRARPAGRYTMADVLAGA